MWSGYKFLQLRVIVILLQLHNKPYVLDIFQGYFGERRQHLGTRDTDMEGRNHLDQNRKKQRKLLCIDDLVPGQVIEDETEEQDEERNEQMENMLRGREELKMDNEEVTHQKSNQDTMETYKEDRETTRKQSDESDEALIAEKKLTEWRTVMRFEDRHTRTTATAGHSEPYLFLLPAEAFFLCYALGCLIVSQKIENNSKDGKGKEEVDGSQMCELSLDELWRVLMENDPDFATGYLVYHHYRTKGWVVKCGLKYGADWGE